MDKGRLLLRVVWILSVLYQSHNNGVQALLRGPPRIQTNEQKSLQVARLGQEFRLNCPVESDPPPIVDWFKDGEDITPAWSRFGFKQTSRTLRIRPVHSEDSGIYKCKGVNGFGSQTVKIRVVVVEDAMTPEMKGDTTPHASKDGSRNQRLESSKVSTTPSAPELTPETLEQSLNPISLLPGNSIQLGCEANGVPTPKVTWLKDGIPVGEKTWKLSNWKLILSKLEFEDSGNYECVARNSLGKASTLIQLHIAELMEKQRPELASDFPANVSVLSGNEATLKCVVRSGFTSMPPHIKWLKRVPSDEALEMSNTDYKNPRLLPADHTHVLVIQETHEERIRINETSENGSFVSKLIFSSTSAGDEGIYICLATNSQGYTFKEAKLTVRGGREPTTTPTLPLPLIVIGLSLFVGLILVGFAQFLRKFQEKNQKRVKQATARHKMATSGGNNPPSHPHPPEGFEQRQPLVSTTAHSSTSSSDQGSRGSGDSSHFHSHHHHHRHHPSIPVKYAMSRCSCPSNPHPYPQLSSPPPPLKSPAKLDKCYNDSFLGSTSHSLHFGHWT